MRHVFQSKKFHKRQFKVLGPILIVLVLALIYYPLLSQNLSFTYGEVLILFITMLIGLIFILLIKYYLSYKRYVKSYILIHNKTLLYKINTTRQLTSEWYYDDSAYKVYSCNHIDQWIEKEHSFIIKGPIELKITDINHVVLKTVQVNQLKLPDYYNHWPLLREELSIHNFTD